jgi:DNA/RNA-binding protein KIN17
MPKAEVGSTKYVANKMKAKGLQRLRWYCQICEKQCRDENGFKQHTQSEGHVRAMLLVGEDPKKFINDYSRQFQRDFLQLLRTAHGEKKVHMNNFYQEYIRDKEHVHMNATKWPSMTEFAKHLGREGLCRVEEGDRGLEIQWIDDSAEAIRRREDIRKKERLMKGDEDIESRLLAQQIKRAKEAEAARAMGKPAETPQPKEGVDENAAPLEPVKVSVSLKAKGPAKPSTSEAPAEDAPVAIDTFYTIEQPAEKVLTETAQEVPQPAEEEPENSEAPVKMSLSLAKKKPSNPLAKKNPFAKKKDAFAPEPEKKMSNAERIMKEELDRKRAADERGHGGSKRPRFN